MSYLHRVLIKRTVQIDNESLRAFWAYHRGDDPFSIRKALSLFRDVLGENPDVDMQIIEGRERLAEKTRHQAET